jgi:hypothetical protein
MNYRLGRHENGTPVYLSHTGYLTPHREQSRLFPSQSNAEFALMKWQKEARRRNDLRRLYLFADNQEPLQPTAPTELPATVSAEKGAH